MRSDFDIQWKRRSEAARNSRCELSEERLQAAMRKAQQQPLREGTPIVVEMNTTRHGARPTLIVAAAACLAAVLIPAGMHAASSPVPTVKYNGQRVQFVCNNNCNAQNVIATFDDYLKE